MEDRVVEYYKSYDENGRLKRHKLEYLTTVEYFNRLFQPGSKILDACAGTGIYSYYLAEQGHKVTSCDLVPNNVDLMKQQEKANLLKDIQVMNVLDLSALADESFDVVLCMGALYHLNEETDKMRAIQECLRILRPGGILVLSYINRFAQFIVSAEEGLKNIENAVRIFYNRTDSVFTYTTPEEIERLASQLGIRKIKHIGADGMIYALSEKMNGATEDCLEQLYGYHLATCEEPGILGASLHGLYFGQK
jgi:2-polyprenyl-3-methyl-5-hydroxy-6-metoxy-1,4-benzoquinol methylase